MVKLPLGRLLPVDLTLFSNLVPLYILNLNLHIIFCFFFLVFSSSRYKWESKTSNGSESESKCWVIESEYWNERKWIARIEQVRRVVTAKVSWVLIRGPSIPHCPRLDIFSSQDSIYFFYGWKDNTFISINWLFS